MPTNGLTVKTYFVFSQPVTPCFPTHRIGICLLMSLLAASWVEAAQAQSLRWATSGMHGRPDATPGYALQRRFPELKFENPVEAVAMPGSGSWMWLMELRGRV
ncbi:MAG: hypothetical protein VW804_00675, partial [Verrucomicrobiota bacterium]